MNTAFATHDPNGEHLFPSRAHGRWIELGSSQKGEHDSARTRDKRQPRKLRAHRLGSEKMGRDVAGHYAYGDF